MIAVASATLSVGAGYRSNYYSGYYPGYYAPGYNYGPAYRGYSVQAGVVPAYSSYQPYYAPYGYNSYYGPSYYGPNYYPYASRA